MIARIRKGNDFKHIWPITWNGHPEDFSDATDITLTAKVYGRVKTLTEGEDYHIDGGTVMVDFTPAICDITGTYTIELNYIKPSAEFIDGDRRSAVDVQAFQIVNTSAEANATEGVSLPSEAMAAYALKYDDLTEAQKDELRGKGITSIDLTGEVGDTKTYTITYADGLTFDFSVTDGHTPIFEFVGTVLHIDGVAGPDLKGETGNGIASIELTSTVGLVKTYTITFTDATTTTFVVTDGSTPVLTFQGTTIYVNGVAGPNLKGETGKGISAVTLLSTAGLAKTYRITFTDSTTFDYVVTDGAAGVGAAVVQTTGASINDVMSQKAVTDYLALKAAHGYASDPKTLKEVDDEVIQLAGEVNQTDAKIKDIENILSTSNPSQSAQISVSGVSPLALPKNASNGGMSIKLEGLTDAGVNFVPTGRIRSVGKNLFDVKRIGWYMNSIINSQGFVTPYATNSTTNHIPVQPNSEYITSGRAYNVRYALYDEKKNLITFGINNTTIITTSTTRYARVTVTNENIESFIFQKVSASVTYEPYRETSLYLTAPELRSNGTVKDEVRKGANGYELVKRISDVDGTVLATPVISHISYGGILNSAENGTVYHEPVIADAGVYGTNMPILLPDYPIATLEEIIKHVDGVDTYLNVANAVIAGDKLSFTHPSLQSGDLVLFTYSFDKESTNGNITATFYDSNVVKIDTVTGKAYKITDVVTNGVLTRTLTEV